MLGIILVLEINPLHSVADACKHLVWDGAEDVGEYGDWQMISEDLHGVAFLAVDTCHVHHADIHADIAHILCLHAVYETIAVAVSESSVKPISITDRYCSYERIALKYGSAAITDGFTCWDVAKLENCSVQGRYVVYRFVVARIDSIKPKTETAHLHLPLREMLYAGRVADVTQYLVWKMVLQCRAPLLVEVILVC